MKIRLRLKKGCKVPVTADNITPDAFNEKSLEEINNLHIWEGNRRTKLGALFEISGTNLKGVQSTTIELVGDLSKVRKIGSQMTTGVIRIEGNAGMYTGEEMKGGTLTVEGNVSSWAGSAMRGGTIEVNKNAGDYVGAAYRGSTKGMQDGTIIIHGNAGVEAGSYMTGGVIRIEGDTGQFVGIRQKDGTIVVKGKTMGRPGAFMTGGKIILCDHTTSILPTFTFEGVRKSTKVEGEKIQGPFYLFKGDLTENGNGRLYVSKNNNEQLAAYEKIL